MSGFGKEIAAEALEERTEKDDITAQILFAQVDIRGLRRQRGGTLKVNLQNTRDALAWDFRTKCWMTDQKALGTHPLGGVAE